MSALRSPAPQETFTMVLASATSLAALKAWFDGAAPGDKAIYASGFTCPSEHESVRAARRWAEGGKAFLTQDRDPADPRRWQYFITKGSEGSGVSQPLSPEKGRVAKAARPDLTQEQLRALMKRLRKAAHDGEPCPSYLELAKFLCLRPDRKGKERARYLVSCLEKQRQISVTPGDARHPVVVTILKPGRGAGMSTRATFGENLRGKS